VADFHQIWLRGSSRRRNYRN